MAYMYLFRAGLGIVKLLYITTTKIQQRKLTLSSTINRNMTELLYGSAQDYRDAPIYIFQTVCTVLKIIISDFKNNFL